MEKDVRGGYYGDEKVSLLLSLSLTLIHLPYARWRLGEDGLRCVGGHEPACAAHAFGAAGIDDREVMSDY